MEADELQELILSIADGYPEATDPEGNHIYLFDISDAWPEQAFTVCKLSALIPLYTIVFPPKGSGRSTSYILPPFPSYFSFDEQQKSVLEFLNKNHPDGDEDKDYLTYDQIRSEVCNLPKKPNAKFKNLVPRYVASKRVKVDGHTRKVNAYRITDEGTFILRYLSRDSRLSDNS